MADFNKDLEKLCVNSAADVGRLLAGCRSSIVSRLDKMAKEMAGLQVPNSSAADLVKVHQQVSAILKRESAKYSSILTLSGAVRINASAHKLSVPATGVSRPLATV